jgi:hypothetical protein
MKNWDKGRAKMKKAASNFGAALSIKFFLELLQFSLISPNQTYPGSSLYSRLLQSPAQIYPWHLRFRTLRQ